MAGTAYDILGVSPSSDPQRVRTAYRELAMRFHPDKWAGADPQTRAEAELRMKQINAAYSSIRAAASRPASSHGTDAANRPPRAQRPDVQRDRSTSSWTYPPTDGNSTAGHVCAACGTPYSPHEALCPRCFWPNRPFEERRRRGDDEDIGVLAVIILFALFVLPGLIGAAGPFVGLLFVPAAVAMWVGVQLRRHL